MKLSYSRLLILFLFFFCIADVYSQTFLPDFPQTDGAVRSMARSGDTLYIGGNFSRIFSPDSSGRFAATIHTQTGSVDGHWPKFNYNVTTVIPDGQGGFFIGGGFTLADNLPRSRLLHVDGSGKITKLLAALGADNSVSSLACSGDTLFVGGLFKNIGGQARQGLAAIKISTEEVLPWNPVIEGSIDPILVHGNTIYIGGYFTKAGGQTRINLAAIDRISGLATSWDPAPNGYVTDLLTYNNRIFIAGNFSSIGGQTRQHLAAINLGTGITDAWNPSVTGSSPPGVDGTVLSMARVGDTLYIGGKFDKVGGQTRINLASIDINTGLPTSWNPQATTASPSRNGTVYMLAAQDQLIYAGGYFEYIGPQQRNYIAAIHAYTGQTTNWQPYINDLCFCLALGNNIVFAGGGFPLAGGILRNRLAAINLNTSFVTSWNPGANDTIYSLCVKDEKVFVGGAFTQAGGQVRNRIASFDKVTGTANAWNPGANGTILTLATNNDILYAGGAFTSVNGQARNRIAAVHAETGVVQAWNPGTNGLVKSIAIHQATVYAGGSFTQAGGASRNYLAAFDTSGTLKPWNPGALDGVHVLAIDQDKLYVGGFFTAIAGMPRKYLASFNLNGTITSWNPGAGYYVYSFAFDQNSVYVGGEFEQIGSKNVTLPRIDKNTGALANWDGAIRYSYNPNAGVRSIVAYKNKIYAGGGINAIGNYLNIRTNLCGFTIDPVPMLDIDADTLRIPTPGKKITLTILSNNPWKLTGAPAWTGASQQEGNGSAVVVLTIDRNTRDARSGIVSFTSDSLLKQVIVLQDEDTNAWLDTDVDTLKLPASGGTASLTVLSNRNWALAPASSWINPSQSIGSGNTVITFSVDSNKSNKRTEVLRFTSDTLVKEVIVLQEGDTGTWLDTDVDTLKLTKWGGSVSLTVLSKRNWMLAPASPWITPSQLSGSGNTVVTFSVDSNQGNKRTEVLRFTSGNRVKEVIVLQEGNTTGLADLANPQLQIYPNPSSGLITVSGLSDNNYWVQIYALAGKLVMQQILDGSKIIDVSALNKGFYFLKVEGPDGALYVNKLCIE